MHIKSVKIIQYFKTFALFKKEKPLKMCMVKHFPLDESKNHFITFYTFLYSNNAFVMVFLVPEIALNEK